MYSLAYWFLTMIPACKTNDNTEHTILGEQFTIEWSTPSISLLLPFLNISSGGERSDYTHLFVYQENIVSEMFRRLLFSQHSYVRTVLCE